MVESVLFDRTTRVALGGVAFIVPFGIDVAAHELGLNEHSPVGDGVVGVEDLNGWHRVDLTDRQGHLVAGVPVGRVDEQTGSSHRES
jgi:hypothetical protein